MSESSSQSPSKQSDAQLAPIISNLKNIQPALGPIMTEKPSAITGSAESATRLRGGCCVRLLPSVFQFQFKLFMCTLGMLSLCLLRVLMLLLLRKESLRKCQYCDISYLISESVTWTYSENSFKPIVNPFLYYKVFYTKYDNRAAVHIFNLSYPAFPTEFPPCSFISFIEKSSSPQSFCLTSSA